MNKLQAGVQFAFAVFAKASTFVYQAKERSTTHRFGITVKVCVAAFGDLYLCPQKLFTACAKGWHSVQKSGVRHCGQRRELGIDAGGAATQGKPLKNALLFGECAYHLLRALPGQIIRNRVSKRFRFCKRIWR